MRRSSDNGEEESSNDDNGSAPHEMPLNQIEEGQPSQQLPPPPYKPRRTTNKRNATGLSFSLKLKPSSSDDGTDTASNIPRRASDPSDVESQQRNKLTSSPPASPTIRRSIFNLGGRRESDNVSEASSDAGGGCSQSTNNNQQYLGGTRKRSALKWPPLFSPPPPTLSTNNSSEDDYYDRGIMMSDYYDPHPTSNNNPHSTNNENNNNNSSRPSSTMRYRLTAIRRFNINDYVLLAPYLHDNIHRRENDASSSSQQQQQQVSNKINLVNRYGFPEWSTSANTAEERRGPYIYLIAKVISIHYSENVQYYTVERMDNNETQRADVQYMEPITSSLGIETAIYAARKSLLNNDDTTNNSGGFGFHHGDNTPTRYNSLISSPGLRWCKPCISTLTKFIQQYIIQQIRIIHTRLKVQLDACLNGNRPYGISIRFTGVNFFVLCSLWYLYIDQLRLAFMPHSADYTCAVVSLFVWLVLVLELLMEVFIRPAGYYKLIRSEKAYLPSTVRYLNTFHLLTEMISLIFFVPEFMCLFSTTKNCGDRFAFSLANSCLMSLYGPTRLKAFYGTSYICILRLRIFGLVRHWCKMWINNTFVRVRGKNGEWRVQRGKGLFVPQGHRGGNGQDCTIAIEETLSLQSSLRTTSTSKKDYAGDEEKKNEFTDDYHLTNASKIGTALFTTNAKRGLIFVFLIGLAPLVPVCLKAHGGTNQQPYNSVKLLQANNLALNDTSNSTCDQLEATFFSWATSNAFEIDLGGTKRLHLLSLVIEPQRCAFMTPEVNVGALAAMYCNVEFYSIVSAKCEAIPWIDCNKLCEGWSQTSEDERLSAMEEIYGIRPSVTISPMAGQNGTIVNDNGEEEPAYFFVDALYNEELSVKRTIVYLFAIQVGMTLFVLLGLSVLRFDAGRLVLGPLRRMLKIVAFYAKHPLSPPPQQGITNELSLRNSFQKSNEAYYYDDDDETSDKELGTFETEQLINTVTKITDLLRKCWGVAGADIISSNLARQEGGLTTYFNPTVPGKAVYALFAFAVIDQFQSHLHALKGDIMILINDIAAVLHEEVYRWGYEDSGQCNKNLGNAFLMVYKIGAVKEVVEKRERAEAVIFQGKNTAKARKRRNRQTDLSTLRMSSLGGSQRGHIDPPDMLSRSHVDNLDLSSLPGMRAFSDRALLGLLKTFAGIHRDKLILNWNNDFRLGAGVGATSINLNFGMDAGWAVEGAVGSSYKIDATYLSPHVNMASRMMSATKQYGVYFLLSQAVQKLLSENAQDKLRHIDTVTVKGSSVKQKIFTYDAKPAHFFLYSKTESQADLDSDRYSPSIWNTDQDLVAMRNHICDDFIEVFNRGRDEYLAGNWPTAVKLLKAADKIMFQLQMDEGYSAKSYNDNLKSLSNLHADNAEAEERLSMGDGPCQRLIAYMEEHGCEAPADWAGYRPLTSK